MKKYLLLSFLVLGYVFLARAQDTLKLEFYEDVELQGKATPAQAFFKYLLVKRGYETAEFIYQVKGNQLIGYKYFSDFKPIKTWKVWNADKKAFETWNFNAIKYISLEQPMDCADYEIKDLSAPPLFPGGQKALQEHFSKHQLTLNQHPSKNTIAVRFCIDEGGYVGKVHIVQSKSPPQLIHKAFQSIQSLPIWIPGKIQDRPVNVTLTYFLSTMD